MKQLLRRTCGPKARHTLRRAYAVYQITHGQHFREPEMAVLKALLRNGDFVADVGANVGVYTNELSLAVGPHGRVYAFEPVRENYDILTTLLRRTGRQNVLPFRMALGASSASCEMVVPRMDGFTEYYWAHVAKPGDSGKRELVELVTLDSLFASRTITRLDFIKCDVEGEELDVLFGAQHTIRTLQPSFLMEVSRPTSTDVFSTLRSAGYRAFVLDGRLIETSNYRDKEFSNYFFLHPRSRHWERAFGNQPSRVP